MRFPTAKELAALTLAVKYSHMLTPQQHEKEAVKTWPQFYKKDRKLARARWGAKLGSVVEALEKEHAGALRKEVFQALELHQGRNQRDLPESPAPKVFYHSDDHEKRELAKQYITAKEEEVSSDGSNGEESESSDGGEESESSDGEESESSDEEDFPSVAF